MPLFAVGRVWGCMCKTGSIMPDSFSSRAAGLMTLGLTCLGMSITLHYVGFTVTVRTFLWPAQSSTPTVFWEEPPHKSTNGSRIIASFSSSLQLQSLNAKRGYFTYTSIRPSPRPPLLFSTRRWKSGVRRDLAIADSKLQLIWSYTLAEEEKSPARCFKGYWKHTCQCLLSPPQ